MNWDIPVLPRAAALCHHRGGGSPGGPEHFSFAKPFITGREPVASAQVRRMMRTASAQGRRHVQALGPLAAVKDFQQVLALRLVQALGLQL